MGRPTLGRSGATVENLAMTSTYRTGGLWEALALAVREGEDDPAESRRRLAALRLRHAIASPTDYETCA
jgi:hypothetical protein